MFRRPPVPDDLPGFLARFRVGGAARLARAARRVLEGQRRDAAFTAGPSTLGFARPDLAFPAYAGLVPSDGVAPIYHFFDRTAGGAGFAARVTRSRARDHRGGRLTYDEHDGTDFVCPAGLPAVAAAPGVLVAVRDGFLRGGLTACVDHGGVITQYTHLARVTAEIGQPLRRGEPLGLTGHAGFDMLVGFPWVPPHVHFMAWVLGQPVDPFLAEGEDAGAATWAVRNEPLAARGPLDGDPAPPRLDDLDVDRGAVERVCALCRDPEIAAELQRAPHDAARAAIVEDSLHHDREAWPEAARRVELRPMGVKWRTPLTLCLPASEYRCARAADAPWTRP